MPLTDETKAQIRNLAEVAASIAETTGFAGKIAARLLRGRIVDYLIQAAERLGVRMTFSVTAAPGADVRVNVDFRK